MKWKWEELNDYNALQIAELAECKDFTSHPYVQRYLNQVIFFTLYIIIISFRKYLFYSLQKLYCDSQGSIPPGTPMWRIVLLVFFPFLIPISGTYIYEDPSKPSFNSILSSSSSSFTGSNSSMSELKVSEPPDGPTRFYHFYNLPVVKIVTSTACCILKISFNYYCIIIFFENFYISDF